MNGIPDLMLFDVPWWRSADRLGKVQRFRSLLS